MKHLLLIGGGHSHVEVLRRFGQRPLPGVEITLVSGSRFTPYSGMLPGLIAGHYRFEETHIDLERVTRFAGCQLKIGKVGMLNAGQREATLTDGATLHYDVASINIGAVSEPPAGSYPSGFVIAAKPVEALLAAWARIEALARQRPIGRIAVVGGGAAGIELLFAMLYRLQSMAGAEAARAVLLSADNRLLPGHNEKVRDMFHCLLRAHDVGTLLGTPVIGVEAGSVITQSGGRVDADRVLWCAGAFPSTSVKWRDIATDSAGFITTKPTLQTLSRPDVFAVGDCASMEGHDIPKSGVYAVRQGPVLAENLRRALSGQALQTYRPQRRALALITSGCKHAIASYDSFTAAGDWVWRWKDRIDRAFVRKYNSLGTPQA